jgi:hypothetical protein
MYQPALRPDQIRSLYQLKLQQRRPMTALAREAVDDYLRRLHRGGKCGRASEAVSTSSGAAHPPGCAPHGRRG